MGQECQKERLLLVPELGLEWWVQERALERAQA